MSFTPSFSFSTQAIQDLFDLGAQVRHAENWKEIKKIDAQAMKLTKGYERFTNDWLWAEMYIERAEYLKSKIARIEELAKTKGFTEKELQEIAEDEEKWRYSSCVKCKRE